MSRVLSIETFSVDVAAHMADEPLVSVVTPVYNGGKFLAECIESVLRQTHQAFEYIILDNASTDETSAIIARYVERDRRIRAFRNESTVPMAENWNRASNKISAASRYYKILCADDTLEPECLERMVAVAARHPTIGFVGSLVQQGETIANRGLPLDREVFAGCDVARSFLRQEVFAFANSFGLIRSDLVRTPRSFYSDAYAVYMDAVACLTVLAEHDFGFVHEVLYFNRVHAESVTSTVTQKKESHLKEWLLMLLQYGPRFFPPEELRDLELRYVRRYHRLLVRGFLLHRSREYLEYHLAGLRQLRRLPSIADLCRAVATDVMAVVSHPVKAYRYLRHRVLH